jgi:hypothetical protein
MIVSVVPDLVSFIDNATDKPGVALGVHSHQEKRGLHACCFENV